MQLKSSVKKTKQGKLREVVKTENGKVKEYLYLITKDAKVIKKGGFKK